MTGKLKKEKSKLFSQFCTGGLENSKNNKNKKQKSGPTRERESCQKKILLVFCKKSYRFHSTYFQFWIKKNTLFLLGPSSGKNEIRTNILASPAKY